MAFHQNLRSSSASSLSASPATSHLVKQTSWSHCAGQSTEAQRVQRLAQGCVACTGRRICSLWPFQHLCSPNPAGQMDFHPQSPGGSDIITVTASVLQAGHRGSECMQQGGRDWSGDWSRCRGGRQGGRGRPVPGGQPLAAVSWLWTYF